MSQVPTPPAGGLPRVQPISVVGVFICCIGYVWTIMNYFQLCAGVNKLDPSANLQAWTLFIPIYSGLYFSNVIKAINSAAASRGVAGKPLDDNIVLNLLVPLLPLYQMMQRYNEVADAAEGKKA